MEIAQGPAPLPPPPPRPPRTRRADLAGLSGRRPLRVLGLLGLSRPWGAPRRLAAPAWARGSGDRGDGRSGAPAAGSTGTDTHGAAGPGARPTGGGPTLERGGRRPDYGATEGLTPSGVTPEEPGPPLAWPTPSEGVRPERRGRKGRRKSSRPSPTPGMTGEPLGGFYRSSPSEKQPGALWGPCRPGPSSDNGRSWGVVLPIRIAPPQRRRGR